MVTDAHEAHEHRPILASGVTLHALPAGAELDLGPRVLLASRRTGPEQTDELATANRDLHKMACAIAAGDISPSALRRRIARRSIGAVQ